MHTQFSHILSIYSRISKHFCVSDICCREQEQTRKMQWEMTSVVALMRVTLANLTFEFSPFKSVGKINSLINEWPYMEIFVGPCPFYAHIWRSLMSSMDILCQSRGLSVISIIGKMNLAKPWEEQHGRKRFIQKGYLWNKDLDKYLV